MNIKQLLAILLIIIVASILFYKISGLESFNIPLRSSSAWDWNIGPGYGAGYGTGYGLYGQWPANLPDEPWKWWMWGRRPLIFATPFTPVPQIDYNNSGYNSKPQSNINISILPQDNVLKLSVDGVAGKTLQLDRLRNYYLHIYSPGMPVMITADGETPYSFEPIEIGNVQVNFDESSPDKLFYMTPGMPNSGGIIYLNSF